MFRSSRFADSLTRSTSRRLHVQSLPCQTATHRALKTRSLSSSSPRHERRYVRFGEAGPSAGPYSSSFLDIRRWGWGERIIAGLLLGGVVYYVGHLEKTPVTGRWRFMDVGPRLQASLAEANRAQLQAEFRGKILPPHHPLVRHIRRVVSRILEENELGSLHDDAQPHRVRVPDDVWMPDDDAARGMGTGAGAGKERQKEWTLLVVNDDTVVNAAVSFGTILVFTGILPAMQDEQGLAAVLGHEIGHEVLRHSEEKISSIKVLIAIATVLDAFGSGGLLSSLIATYLLQLPNSRKQEYEADRIGMRLASRACYDPEAATRVFGRLRQMEVKMGGGKWEFFSTHPDLEKRIRVMHDLLPEAYTLRASNPACGDTPGGLAAFRDALGGMGMNLFADGGLPGDGWKFV
ncbi:hypothetical protein CERSUDRAFT_156412 [Gelatoporia subvermispora B]|uniref:Peptidase M48 domain-containing protein n=1 Tax=Ceriporiopsis subvermispora (strain B) TaxID=914234 RepID=M2PHY2_CERS8|nr:hypothetical protein CERSUDRAFT_156412 [Gelatoporia subvermispora B]